MPIPTPFMPSISRIAFPSIANWPTPATGDGLRAFEIIDNSGYVCFGHPQNAKPGVA